MKGSSAWGGILARPPIAGNRLTRLDDGRLELQLKRPWRDGMTSFVFTPHELIERLIALVPRRVHLSRYFGKSGVSPRHSLPALESSRRLLKAIPSNPQQALTATPTGDHLGGGAFLGRR